MANMVVCRHLHHQATHEQQLQLQMQACLTASIAKTLDGAVGTGTDMFSTAETTLQTVHLQMSVPGCTRPQVCSRWAESDISEQLGLCC